MTRTMQAAFAHAAAMCVLMTPAAHAQMRPPVVSSMTPYGIQGGTTAEFAVEGANLGGCDQVLFDVAGLSAEILGYEDLGPDIRVRRPGETGAIIQDRAQKGRLRLRIAARPDVPVGRHGFRLRTPLGTTSFMPLWVGEHPDVSEQEPNDEAGHANALTSPVTVNGWLGILDDVDYYRVIARAGQDLVAAVVAAPLGSSSDTAVTIVGPSGKTLASNDDFGASRDALAIYRPGVDGQVLIRVHDANPSGGRHHYRLTIGTLPVVTSVFPLGVDATRQRALTVDGVNLGRTATARAAEPIPERPGRAPVTIGGREPLRRVEVAVGAHLEVAERERNDSLARAQPLASLPATVNGRIWSSRPSDRDLFRLRLRKGETVVARVEAQRLGSPLDSLLEVLDARGNPVPRARLRAVWETTIDLRNRGSLDSGLRLLAWDELRPGDHVYVDRELIRVEELPKGPDEDVSFISFRGRRVAYEETTPEGHALLRPVYKVEMYPPGAEIAPTGLPVFDLFYRNDDGGPLMGKDSQLTFTAPESGTYYLRLSDTRGGKGRRHAYRLTVSAPSPEFQLFVSPANPNVPRGGRVPITVFAWRQDGFDGPIDVALRGLPDGLSATAARILPGESSVTLTLSAGPEAAALVAPLAVVGRATIDARPVEREARADERVSVVATAAPPDVRVVSVTPEVVELAPGERVRVTAVIERANGFAGRVPLAVNNLPRLLTVPDIGLNGILVTEDQTSRSFEIVADDRAEPMEQVLFVTARVETNGGTVSNHSSAPIRIRVVGKQTSR